jgi:hypothetical protein
MAKRRPRLNAKQRKLHAQLSLLTEDQLALFRTMNDKTTPLEARLRAAMVLAPILHKPLPVRYVPWDEAQRSLAKVLGK